ncbi:VOC family protein [Fictibacillus sp. UD]|uniref:VOC family protein n=1 Tax=Fictibacillus sp. UD TaxID=3038777 RepID=UPI0037460BF7
MATSDQKVTTFLLFQGQAEEAMNVYTSLFADSEIKNILYQEDGTVLHATFSIKGQNLMCIDSGIKHEFTFTPAISLFVECDTLDEIHHLFESLSNGGAVLMPLGELPGMEKFAWVQDSFGVSWQLSLPSRDN